MHHLYWTPSRPATHRPVHFSTRPQCYWSVNVRLIKFRGDNGIVFSSSHLLLLFFLCPLLGIELMVSDRGAIIRNGQRINKWLTRNYYCTRCDHDGGKGTQSSIPPPYYSECLLFTFWMLLIDWILCVSVFSFIVFYLRRDGKNFFIC